MEDQNTNKHHYFNGTKISIDKLSKELLNKKYCIIRKYFNHDQCDLLVEHGRTEGQFPDEPGGAQLTSISRFKKYYLDKENAMFLNIVEGEEKSDFKEKEEQWLSFKNIEKKEDSKVFFQYPFQELFINISLLRLKIVTEAVDQGLFLQKDFDGNFLFKRTEEIVDFKKYFLDDYDRKKYWCRFMCYGVNDMVRTIDPHKDAYGEVMAILFLTSPNIDYSGGLFIYDEEIKAEKCIDKICEKGDLLFLSGNEYFHWVDVQDISGNGRKTFFINNHPTPGEDPSNYGTKKELDLEDIKEDLSKK